VAGEERVGRRAFGEFARRTAVGGAAEDIGGPRSAGAGFCGGYSWRRSLLGAIAGQCKGAGHI
jgi:hypothetical protein